MSVILNLLGELEFEIPDMPQYTLEINTIYVIESLKVLPIKNKQLRITVKIYFTNYNDHSS